MENVLSGAPGRRGMCLKYSHTTVAQEAVDTRLNDHYAREKGREVWVLLVLSLAGKMVFSANTGVCQNPNASCAETAGPGVQYRRIAVP